MPRRSGGWRWGATAVAAAAVGASAAGETRRRPRARGDRVDRCRVALRHGALRPRRRHRPGRRQRGAPEVAGRRVAGSAGSFASARSTTSVNASGTPSATPGAGACRCAQRRLLRVAHVRRLAGQRVHEHAAQRVDVRARDRRRSPRICSGATIAQRPDPAAGTADRSRGLDVLRASVRLGWIGPVCFPIGGFARCFGMPAASGADHRRALAQLAEHRSPKPKVGGSSPSCPARKHCTSKRREGDKRGRRQRGSGPARLARRRPWAHQPRHVHAPGGGRAPQGGVAHPAAADHLLLRGAGLRHRA